MNEPKQVERKPQNAKNRYYGNKLFLENTEVAGKQRHC